MLVNMLDLLSDILTKLSVQGTLYFRTSFTSPWGVAVPSFKNVARFHFAHRGNCSVSIDGVDKPISLAQGDLIIIPHGATHNLYNGQNPEEIVLPLDNVLEKSGYDGNGVLVYGGDDNDHKTQLICGHFSFESHARHVLIDRLPPFIHVKNYGETSGRWMEATLRMISDETGNRRLGSDLIALKMSEAILAQALRSFIENDATLQWGLTAFSDKQLCKALDAFHKKPDAPWTVETMAQCAGMSRTSFAVQFQKKMAMSPMQYVSSWRMEIAKQYLTNPSMSLSDTAESVGYASDSAFSRVFKKEIGMTPASFRKAATL